MVTLIVIGSCMRAVRFLMFVCSLLCLSAMGRMLCASSCSFVVVRWLDSSVFLMSARVGLSVSSSVWCASLSVIIVCTSRCCVLLCRLCSILWWVLLVVVIICVCDVVSSVWLLVLVIVVVISLVKFVICNLMLVGSGSCMLMVIVF